MTKFYDELEFLLDKMETQYCVYPFIALYNWFYSVDESKNN